MRRIIISSSDTSYQIEYDRSRSKENRAVNYSEWFHQHLQASADGFVWAVEQVPAARYYSQPPKGLGDWHVARHVFHMLDYERQIVVPVMQQWLDAPPAVVGWEEEDSWQANCDRPVEHLLAEFRAVRCQQIAMLPQIGEHLWHEQQMTGWGPVPLFWVVTKTYQHTNEHTSDVLRIALNWDYYAAQAQAGGTGAA